MFIELQTSVYNQGLQAGPALGQGRKGTCPGPPGQEGHLPRAPRAGGPITHICANDI